VKLLNHSLILVTVLLVLAFCGPMTGVGAAGESSREGSSQHYLAADVPLGSYVYDYLEKLDGLGYLKDMRTGAKPYSRLQAARWTREIALATLGKGDVPGYAREMVMRLEREFGPELARLEGKKAERELKLKDWTVSSAYYHGDSLQELGTKASWQPLNTNNGGLRYDNGLNAAAEFTVDGGIKDWLVYSVTPRFSVSGEETKAELKEGYVKTGLNNVALTVGRENLWWGQGARGSRSLTNNATPFTSARLTNVDALDSRWLGPSYVTVLYSVLEEDRADVRYPSLAGIRGDFVPGRNFTFALSRMDIVGGQGHMLNRSELRDYLFGNNASLAEDDWDTQAGGDFRWRLPKAGGVQVYGEVYGEDQAGSIPVPSELAELVGVYVPRLSGSGDWDLTLEWAHTRPSWYRHSLYTNGWTYKDSIFGDVMGANALRYYGKVTRYLPGEVQLSVNAERLVQNFSGDVSQTVDSLWLAARKEIGPEVFLSGSLGVAKVRNVNYTEGATGHNYLAAVSITREFY